MLNKLSLFSDPSKISDSTMNIFRYLAPIEVRNFVESECIESHIFVDLVIMSMAGMSNVDSDFHRLYILTENLINKFDENEANGLIDLADRLSKLRLNELYDMF